MWQTGWKGDGGIKQIILKQGLHSQHKIFLSLDCIFGLMKVGCAGQDESSTHCYLRAQPLVLGTGMECTMERKLTDLTCCMILSNILNFSKG